MIRHKVRVMQKNKNEFEDVVEYLNQDLAIRSALIWVENFGEQIKDLRILNTKSRIFVAHKKLHSKEGLD